MPKLNLRTIGLLVLIVIVVGAVYLFSSRNKTSAAENVSLGQMFTALELDEYGCPVESVREFYPTETIYAGLEESFLPRDTTLFARLSYDGQTIEDTEEIVAEQDMESCVWFEFVPTDFNVGLVPGEYRVDIFVNGSPVDASSFVIGQEEIGPVYQDPQAGQVGLGGLFTASQVDANGCPVDNVSQFYPDEPVYVAMQESYIPEGTELFARLLHDGRPVEDTDLLVADQDMQTCVWFVFDPANYRGGWEPGDYQAEVYVNGFVADSIPFEVQ